MMYTVKDDEFPVPPGETGFRELIDAIKIATAYAQLEPVDVFKVDETGVHVVYQVGKQPVKQRGDGWHDITPREGEQ